MKTTDEFVEDYGAKREDIPDSHYSSKVYDLEVEIANEDNMDTGINLFELGLRNNAAYASFNELYYRIANADKGYKDISIAVRPGTSVTMHLIFGLPDQTLSRWAFEHIEDLDLKLVISLYPEKKMIELT